VQKLGSQALDALGPVIEEAKPILKKASLVDDSIARWR
jgi:hypothetical protein